VLNWGGMGAEVGGWVFPKPPLCFPARGPPTDWGVVFQAHDDREAVQMSPDELPAIDIQSL
jgi:hypothetical protein